MRRLIEPILAHIHVLAPYPLGAPLAVGIQVHHAAGPNDLLEGYYLVERHAEDFVREEAPVRLVVRLLRSEVAMAKGKLLVTGNEENVS